LKHCDIGDIVKGKLTEVINMQKWIDKNEEKNTMMLQQLTELSFTYNNEKDDFRVSYRSKDQQENIERKLNKLKQQGVIGIRISRDTINPDYVNTLIKPATLSEIYENYEKSKKAAEYTEMLHEITGLSVTYNPEKNDFRVSYSKDQQENIERKL